MSEDAIAKRGLLLVISSPSGAGKTTITRELLGRDSNLVMSVSATTRPPRPGEVNGKDYSFVSEDEFQRMVRDGELLEYAKVFDYLYGTPKAPVEAALRQGRDVVFDVDWQGERQLKQNAGADLVTIFVLPPSYAELERRLRARAQDPEEVVRKRMAHAATEMSHYVEYDYVIINRDLEESVRNAQTILDAERQRLERFVNLHDFVKSLSKK